MWDRRLIQMITVVVASLLLVLCATPQTAHAHGVVPNGQATTLIAGQKSGPYIIDVSHYAADNFVVFEVHLELANGGELPAETRVDIAALSARTGQTMSRGLLRHGDVFIARLPHIDEVWQVEITFAGEAGDGSASARVRPYRSAVETSAAVRYLVMGLPFMLLLLAMIGYKRFGFSLVSKESDHTLFGVACLSSSS